ncbi:MAG: DUF1009 domain-containing protein [Azospirillum sp.]|nr:DUF1009 domain-containing protein [Azospirillum sp.]
MLPRLAILAGGGTLPAQLAEAARADGRAVFVVGFEGHSDRATLAPFPHLWTRLGAAGAILDWLRSHQVTELVFAGPIRRPSLGEIMPDWRAAQFLLKIGVRALGDDGLLRAIARGLEDEGFRVIAIQDVIATLLAPQGAVGNCHPDADADRDIARGVAILRQLGALDIGQAVVVQQGMVLGLEAIEGTDALIARCGELRRPGPGGVLVKTRKPQQDKRLDLPTIGPATVERAAAAGLRGIAVEAGATLMLDRAEVRRLADHHGLFVVGIASASGTEGTP